MRKIIFGKTYRFECEPQYMASLLESVELYEDTTDEKTDVVVHIRRSLPRDEVLSVNPKIHRKTREGMVIGYRQAEIGWSRSTSGQLQVDLAIKPSSALRRMVSKIRSIEFPREVETFEQILHELVLIPSVYFFSDLAPVHAACVSTAGGACLLAGTGGVGKSSALLAHRRSDAVDFISDDIAIVSADARVYGNMGWAKIYGYNCSGSKLKQEILAGRGWFDALHFNIRNHLNPAGVRRKVSPDRLYRNYRAGEVPLSRLYYLVRENVQEIQLSELSVEDAVVMTIAVMNTEYSQFHNHLHWEQYNAVAIGGEALLTLEQVYLNWKTVLGHCFAPLERFKIRIPLEIDHVTYQKRIEEIVLRQ